MKKRIKNIQLNSIFFVLLFVASFFTGCSFQISDGTVAGGYNYPEYSGEYTDPTEMRNLLVHIDFDSPITTEINKNRCHYTQDMIIERWKDNPKRAKGVLNDNHGNVCELNGKQGNSFFEIVISVQDYSVLNFQFKSDVINDNVLRMLVDGVNYNIPHKGYGDGWKSVTKSLTPGMHSIRWYIPQQFNYSPQLLNVIYLDNITVVNNNIEYIEIYPKGVQETYVGGMPIQFSAVPLRGDRSIIENLPVFYSVSGCGSIDSNGVFRPTGKGTCTVTANINGKVAKKTNIIVHGKNYLSDAVTIGNHTFTGKYSLNSGDNLDTENTKYDYTETPMSTNFNTDGFFVLKGRTKVPLIIKVQKNDSSYFTHFIIRDAGDFYKRIWLRFGAGDYFIDIYEASNINFANPQDSRYEGDFFSADMKFAKRIRVKNTSNISETDAVWLMPSEVVQSDSFYISNIAHSIRASLPKYVSTGDKLRAIHDWELRNFYYDMVSLNHQDKRKRQDAEAMVKYGTGVCEAYANLYAALVRLENIKTSVVVDFDTLSHAWNHVLYDDNQWYLVDVTWDDPVPDGANDYYNDKAAGSENYTFFMTGFTDEHHIVQGADDSGRAATEMNTYIPKMKGVPDGWY